MNRAHADTISGELVDILKPYCKQILICGGFRRGKEEAHDIDLVIQPDEEKTAPIFGGVPITNVIEACKQFGNFVVNGEAIKRFRYRNTPIELWVADGIERHFETLIVIRTGSEEFTKCLVHFAKQKQWTLHAGGQGLCTRGHWKQEDRGYDKRKCDIILTKERDIIERLLGKYFEPQEREHWIIPATYTEAGEQEQREKTIRKNTGFYMLCPCGLEWTDWKEWSEHREMKHPKGEGLSLRERALRQ